MAGPNAALIDSKIPKYLDALMAAKKVVLAVRGTLDVGASNVPKASPAARSVVPRMRAQYAPKILAPRIKYFFRLLTDIRTISDAAIRTRSGNCGEQSAVAFIMLLDKDIEPIDYVELDGPGDDHAFVVIGRRENSDISSYDAQAWGPDAVVCDPWMDKAYACSEMRSQLASRTSTFKYKSLFRYRTIDGHAPL